MITDQANQTITQALNSPLLLHCYKEVQYSFDGGATLIFYNPAEQRCCFDIYPDGSTSLLLVDATLQPLNLNVPETSSTAEPQACPHY